MFLRLSVIFFSNFFLSFITYTIRPLRKELDARLHLSMKNKMKRTMPKFVEDSSLNLFSWMFDKSNESG